MILEVAVLNVRAGHEGEFETAFSQAILLLMKSGGYVSHQLRRCMENQSRYILLVEWGQLEDHTVGFRGSPSYRDWKRLLHHFYDPFPTVEHYQTPL